MTDALRDRFVVLRDLLNFARPMQDVSAELSRFDWDFDGKGIELRREHIAKVLHRYVDGGLSEFDVETWANLIESREDICVDPLHENAVNEIIYNLANPVLTQRLDKNVADLFLQRIENEPTLDGSSRIKARMS